MNVGSKNGCLLQCIYLKVGWRLGPTPLIQVGCQLFNSYIQTNKAVGLFYLITFSLSYRFLPLDKKLVSPTNIFGWEFFQICNLELVANGAWLTHLGSSLAANRSPLVGIHTGWPLSFQLGGWHNLTNPYFLLPKKKKNLEVVTHKTLKQKNRKIHIYWYCLQRRLLLDLG